MRALDLFCGAGGATRGLQKAGFHVTGIDSEPQPRYYGDDFIRKNALCIDPRALGWCDFIWASPPCQAHTVLNGMHNAKTHLSLIEDTRALLIASGKPYVIENVIGAPLHNPFMLCGTMFGLGVGCAELRRHRIFETNFRVVPPACKHSRGREVIGIYGGHVRNRRRTRGDRGQPDYSAIDGAIAMGVHKLTLNELSQAVPPAYSEFIARAWIASRQSEAA